MQKKYILFSIIAILAHLAVMAQENFLDMGKPFSPTPKREVRAVWLTTIGNLDWPKTRATNASSIERQKRELTETLDKLRRAGINTILLQTRVRATTIYPSAIEPWDACMSGTQGRSPGYDPLAFAIDECHKRGMELHAWVVTIPIGKWTSYGCTQLRKRNAGMVVKVGQEGYMNPEKSQTATYLANICGEITDKYDIDGIHLDYIRYPETWKYKQSKAACRENITRIVKAINQRVKSRKPWVKLSCSPIGKYDDLPRYSSRGWNARQTVCQDAVAWMNAGLMDALFPMMYFQGQNFYPFLKDWKERVRRGIVVPGLAIYMMSPREKNWDLDIIAREMQVSRQNGMGHTFFRSQFLTDNTKGIMTFAERDFNVFPALPPAMTWMNANLPTSPTELTIDTVAAVMSWKASRATNDSPNVLYNIYVGDASPVDVSDARNLIATRIQKTSTPIEIAPGRYYAVTAIDRYGNESAPVQSHKPTVSSLHTPHSSLLTPHLLKCDGRRLLLPKDNEPIDFRFYVIETMQGQIINTIARKTDIIDVSHLPEGMYQIRTIGTKGKSHRIGFFAVRR